MSCTEKTIGVIRVTAWLFDVLLEEARSDPSVECCGLLAGCDGIISAVFPAKNTLASATAYEIAPEELFVMFLRMRQQKLDHLGIYHSHPNTDNAPSPTDIERAYHPEAAYFIISPRADAANPVRAFRIEGGQSTELAIEWI